MSLCIPFILAKFQFVRNRNDEPFFRECLNSLFKNYCIFYSTQFMYLID